MNLTLSPLHPLFAAEASGVDLRNPPTPALCAAIDDAMNRYAVLVLRDQPIDDEQEMAFARALGPLEPMPAQVSIEKQRLQHREMVDISNLDVDGSLLGADDRRRLFNLGNMLWHTDSSFKATPAKYSMLHARAIPPEGGETEFADMRAAWDALPEKMQQRIEHMVCDHSLIYSRALLGFDAFNEEERKAFAPVPQRLVRRHAGSGRRSLFLASHIGTIHGMPRPEALMLIRDLTEHATQREFVYSHTWRVHDLVIWDNRCTMHRGRAYDDQRYRRDMRRMTLEDSAPTLAQPA
ncbi:MAG: TauD/TfdA dioxygenase family protein [Burkholderiales bacterium]